MLKTIPYYFYQVDAIESWLDEQAQKGLFPLETRFGTAMSFRKDTPRAVRYRIDVKRNIGYTDENARIAAYRALCWVLLGGFWLVRLVAAIRAAETTQQRILLTRDYHCTATVRRSLRLHRATNLMLALALVIIAVLWITLDRSRDIPVSDVSVPTVSEVFPGVSPAPSRHPGSPHNENSWASESPSLLYRLRYVRQRGAYMIDPEIGQYRSSWYYDADVYQIAWTWLAKGYAQEQAQDAGAEAITVPGWECAWYAADAVPYGGQMLVLQSGKTVWRIGYDGEHRLTDALGVFARA